MRREEQTPAITDCQRLLMTACDMLNIMRDTVHLGIQAGYKRLCFCQLIKLRFNR